MNDLERSYYNAFVRVWDSGNESAADFPAVSIGGQNFILIAEAVDEIQQHGAAQAFGASHQITV